MSTELHDAARNGDLIGITKAIGEGTNLDVRDNHARTPLMLAAWAGQSNCLKALLAAGAKPGIGASDDMNALHFAAQKGHTECVRWLLNEGAKTGSKNSRTGANALMMAAQNGHKETVELLLKKKADPLAKNKRVQTARDVCKNEEIKQILEAAEDQRAKQLEEEAAKRKEKNANKQKKEQEEVTEREAEVDEEKNEFIGPAGPPEAIAAAVEPQIGANEAERREGTEKEGPPAKKYRVTLNYDEEDFEET